MSREKKRKARLERRALRRLGLLPKGPKQTPPTTERGRRAREAIEFEAMVEEQMRRNIPGYAEFADAQYACASEEEFDEWCRTHGFPDGMPRYITNHPGFWE